MVRSLRLGTWAPPLAAFAALYGLWAILAGPYPYVLPPPGRTLAQLADRPGVYLDAARTTLVEAIAGLAGGFGGAMLAALAMAQSPLVRRALLPVAIVVSVTPVVAVAPALTVGFGLNSTPDHIITALVVFFPALVNALAGFRAADPQILDVFATLGASRWEVVRRVRLPSAVPYLFAAARVCFPLSLVGAVVAEFVTPGAVKGLGTFIATAAQYDDLPEVYAAVLTLAALGVALSLAVVAAETATVRRRLGSRPSPI